MLCCVGGNKLCTADQNWSQRHITTTGRTATTTKHIKSEGTNSSAPEDAQHTCTVLSIRVTLGALSNMEGLMIKQVSGGKVR